MGLPDKWKIWATNLTVKSAHPAPAKGFFRPSDPDSDLRQSRDKGGASKDAPPLSPY